MPNLAPSPEAHASPTSGTPDIVAPKSPKGAGVLEAVKAGLNAPRGERLRTFLKTMRPDVLPTTSEQASPAVTELPLTAASRKFIAAMDRPSLFTKLQFSKNPEMMALAQLAIKDANRTLLLNLLGEDTIRGVETGEVDLNRAVAQKIKEMASSGNSQGLRELLGEATDETVFALRRLEYALRANNETRQAGKTLRQLRKAANFTVPQYIMGKRDVIAEGIVHDVMQRSQR